MTAIPQAAQVFAALPVRSMAQRRMLLRQTLWPDVSPQLIWNRKSAKGFTTIPRTLPLVGQIVDSQSSGKPLSSVYMDLWCRANDEGFVECKLPAELAFSSGFTTSRGIHTWAERVTELENLGFVKVRPGPAGPRNFILLINPYYAVTQLRVNGKVEDRYWYPFVAQSNQIGATDLNSFLPSVPPPMSPPADPSSS